ncbi:MAG: hypothetical protein ABEI75_00335 [Halobaculum sp.]
MRGTFGGPRPALIAVLGVLLLPTPLVADYGNRAVVHGSVGDPNVGLAVAGFLLTVVTTYGGVLLGLVLTAVLALDLVRCRGDESSWSPTYLYLLGGLCHAAGPLVPVAFLPSVPVLGYYLFRRRA